MPRAVQLPPGATEKRQRMGRRALNEPKAAPHRGQTHLKPDNVRFVRIGKALAEGADEGRTDQNTTVAAPGTPGPMACRFRNRSSIMQNVATGSSTGEGGERGRPNI